MQTGKYVLFCTSERVILQNGPFWFAKRAVSASKTARFTIQNGPFCKAECNLLNFNTLQNGLKTVPKGLYRRPVNECFLRPEVMRIKATTQGDKIALSEGRR